KKTNDILKIENGRVNKMNIKLQDIRSETNKDVPDYVFVQQQEAKLIQSDWEAVQTAKHLAEVFKKNASYRDANRLLPLEEIVEFSQSGLWGINIPKQYGGAQVKHRTLSQVIRILASADPALTQISENHLSFLEQVRLDATEEQKQLIFGAILKGQRLDRKSTRLNSSHVKISYAVFCLKKKTTV